MSGVGRITGFTGHPKGETKTNLAVGIDHGKALTKRELKPKQSYRKGRIQKRWAAAGRGRHLPGTPGQGRGGERGTTHGSPDRPSN